MFVIDVRTGDADSVDAVNQFYARFAFGSVAHCGDTLLMAREAGEMAGVVRLCQEQGHFVLRGMLVDAARRRQGIGQHLLAALVGRLGAAPCYALPFRHLPAFYSRVGFVPCPVGRAPQHLQRRLAEYVGCGLEVILVQRPGRDTMKRRR